MGKGGTFEGGEPVVQDHTFLKFSQFLVSFYIYETLEMRLQTNFKGGSVTR